MKKFLLMSGILACMLTIGTKTAYAQTVGLGDAIGNSATEFSAGMEAGTRIAIMSMRSGSAMMSNHIIDEMTMAFLHTQRFLVVNRAQLELIAAEQHLALDGLIDDATMQSIGRLAGAQFIAFGAFEPFGEVYRLRVQIIEVETAIIWGIFTANVRNDAVVSSLLGAAGREPPRRDPDQPRVNWVSVEFVCVPLGELGEFVFAIGGGIRYERGINELFSLGGAASFSVHDGRGDTLVFDALATVRFFPLGSPFYLEAGLGFGFLHKSWEIEREYRFESETYSGVMLSLGAGVRLGGRTRGFFANPFVSFVPVAPGDGSRFRLGIGFGGSW